MATTPQSRDALATAFAAARTLLDQGRLGDAERLAGRLARDHAGIWQVHQLVAAVAQRAGRLPAALAALGRAIETAPDEAEPHRDRARLLMATGDFGAAEDAARRATDLAADAAENWLVLGRACRRNDNPDEAEAAYRRARDLDPSDPAADMGIGLVARARGDLAAAEAAYRAALEHDPALDAALFNLANTLVDQGRAEDAIACYRRAIAARPEAADSHYNLAQILLMTGRLADGWREYDWRWKATDFPFGYRRFPLPEWSGDPAGAETVLLWAEQGIGDEIMFAGLLPDAPLPARCIMVECAPRLVPLFTRSFPDLRVVGREGAAAVPSILPQPTRHAPLLALAALSRTEESRFPRHDGYLAADPARVAEFRDRYGSGGPLVGIAWRTTNPTTGPARTIPLTAWGPILRQSSARFLSLQYGDCAAELAAARDATGVAIQHDPGVDPLTDLDGFAAQVAATDLIVSIDNATVHMAGALGRPVWTMVPAVPDWRWLLDRTDSPWYPSMRLFRQARAGDWASVVDAVAAALAREVAGP